ncbi:MAG: hypothetical protein QW171_04755 [Candidatus Bilamarchaeaceae archaeon]
MKSTLVFFGLLCIFGLALAIQPAETWTVGVTGKYTQVGQANVTTEGGNVTNLNLSGNISTEKWAGFWGNVSGLIVLSPGTNMFYTWTWTSANGGEVCAVAAPSGFDWTNVQRVAASAIDTIWGFVTADTDSATYTLTESCNVAVAGRSVSGSAGETTGGGTFQTCAVADGVAPAAKSDIAFCVNITQGGALFNGQTGDYQLMTATNETMNSFETYYFWLELD